MTTNELETQELGEQEVREAEAILALWKKFGEKDSESLRISKDVEEALGNCYGNTKDFSDGPGDVLAEVVKSAKEIIAEAESCTIDIEDYCQKNGMVVGVGTPPVFFDQRMGAMIEKFLTVTERSRKALPIVKIMTDVAVENPVTLADSLPILEKAMGELGAVEALWLSLYKDTREKLGKIVENFRSGRGAIHSTAEIWAQASEARWKYLEKRGLHVAPINSRRAIFSVSTPAPKSVKHVSLRRQKKEQAKTSPAQSEKSSQNSLPEQPWKVFCINAVTQNVFASLELSPTDDGTKLVEILSQYCVWPHGGRRTVASLRRLLKMAPNLRGVNVDSFRLKGANWYRLKFGKKYRMLVRPKDDERTVFLMAEHRTKLYSDIGRKKNES